jgi:AbrB family looped-hinge helix DNA binding protein
MQKFCIVTLTQITPRGQVTLPAEIRKVLSLKGGVALEVAIEGGRIILQPVMTLPIRIHSESDLAMFAEAGAMSDGEIAAAADRWKM